ncbi:hypothetical protein CALCODRAFT_88248 [Calocera cornea HHB12733]|uniref:WHIM1 domain-containing protein n=1 Tax=Calocera cornea HHB12733 TaxID=1353952 RepID=A0A165DCN5_9BASI|nr:hypothetical protein CALCODRAFT_88248 [Calocera cornea HHB12733]
MPPGTTNGHAKSSNGNGAGEEKPLKEKEKAPAVPAEPEHPRDRWEMAYVWAFLNKFCGAIVAKTTGLESVMDLEDALLLPEHTPVLEAVLLALMRMCRPNTHSRIDAGSIMRTLQLLVNERKMECLWYDIRSKILKSPLDGVEDVFSAPWGLKLDVLRQLVDWALVTDGGVREKIRAVRDATKYQSKPKEGEPVDMGETIVIEPIGLDLERRRYWVLDYSGRLYRSGNPWKNVCPFVTVTSSHVELSAEVERMEGVLTQLDKDRAAKPRAHPVTKWENSMRSMVKRLREEVVPKVEQEEIRQTKKRKALEVRQNYIALHELRETRTRRQKQKPRYVYDPMSEDEDVGDDFVVEDDVDFDSDEPDAKRPRASRVLPTRSSGRISAANAAKDQAEREVRTREWRGERRSSRFGGPSLDDAPASVAGPSSPGTNGTGSEIRRSTEPITPALDDDELGAQAIFDSVREDKKRKEENLRNVGGLARPRENEVVVEAPKGRKPGRYWFYAVEPVTQQGTLEIPDPPDIRRRPRKSRQSLLRVESNEPSREGSKEPSEATTGVKEEDIEMDAGESHTLTNGSGSRHDTDVPAKGEPDTPPPMVEA